MATDLRVVVTRRLPAAVMQLLRSRPSTQVLYHDSDEPVPHAKLAEMIASGPGASAIVCMLSDKIDKQLIESAQGSLKAIATMSVGYSHIDMTAVKEHGIRVGYTPGVLTDATADLVLALTLATCR